MDIYGCSSSWQINRTNEQPQLYGWPTPPPVAAGLAAGLNPCERVPPDGHVMPPPSALPWSPAGLPWGSPAPPPPLVHFTAHTPHLSHSPIVHSKRKVELEPVIPAKQFITEEKMAAHLNGLHISHEYTEHGERGAPAAPAAPAAPDTAPAAAAAAVAAAEWLRGARTIVLADEIKRLQQEPLIPPALLERLEKPCMSLMVWSPKESVLPAAAEDEADAESQSVRRGVLVPDAAGMDVEM